MADFEEEEEDDDRILKEDMKNFNELGLMRDSHELAGNLSDKPNRSNQFYNKTSLNLSTNVHNKIAEELAKDLEEEIDENNDAEPEELAGRNQDELNNTFDDIWTLHLFGRKDPEEKYIPLSKNAKFFERLLHPLQYGSLRGSIFALSSMCLEASSMVLAIRSEQFGMVNFLILLALGALNAYWCLIMMIKAGKNIKEKSYSKVVKTILGKKYGVFMNISIALYLYGALISFQVIIYQLLGAVVYDIMKMVGKLDEEYKNFDKYLKKFWSEKIYLKFPIMFGVAGMVFPMCLLKDITKMRIPSLIGVIALVYSIIVVFIESFFYLINENTSLFSEMNWINITKAFDLKKGIPFFGGISTVFYLYSCHAGAFPVYKALRNNTTRRIKKVFRRSIILDFFIYFFVAAASFLTCPKNSPELILYRENLSGFDPDYFILIAKIGVIFNLFFSTPANYSAFRISFFELVWGNANITTTKNIIVTAVALSSLTLIGALYDKILDYIELLGGFCSVIFCILIPGLIYAKNDNIKKSKLVKYLTIITVVLLSLIGYTSGLFTILFKMVKIYDG